LTYHKAGGANVAVVAASTHQEAGAVTV
jgi:hypothetical protein